MLNIFIDSCADLSQQLIAANGLRMIPLHVLVDGKDHYDSDLNLDQLFASEEITGELPKTSAPSFLEFVNYFDVEGPVIYIGIPLNFQRQYRMHSWLLGRCPLFVGRKIQRTNTY